MKGAIFMSLYGNKRKICGVPCGLVLRGSVNGQYKAVFEREYASLEAIEAINWDRPEVEGDSVLPAGYGFTVEDISYSSANRCYTVTLQVAEQYLGDVAGYQAQVAELTAEAAEKANTIQTLEDQLAEADEALIALYEAQEAQAGGQDTQGDAQDVSQEAQEGGEVSV